MKKNPFAARNHTINAEALRNSLKCRRSGHNLFSSTTRHCVVNQLRLRMLAYLPSPHRYISIMLLLYINPSLTVFPSGDYFEHSYVALTLKTTCNMMAIRWRCDRYDTIRTVSTSHTGGDPLRRYAFLQCKRDFGWMGRICYVLDMKKNEEGKGKEVRSIRWLGCYVFDWEIGIRFPAGYRFCFLRSLVISSGAGSVS